MQIKKIKCKNCGRTLLFAEYVKGEIKCPRCNEVNKIEVKGNKGKSQ